MSIHYKPGKAALVGMTTAMITIVVQILLASDAMAQCTPTTMQVEGGGTICPSSSVLVTISTPEIDVGYQLKKNGTPIGSEVFANFSQNPVPPISWPIYDADTDGDTYTVRAKVDQCGTWYDMSGEALVSVAPEPPEGLSLDFSDDPLLVCPATGITVTASGGTSNYHWEFTPPPGGEDYQYELNGPTLEPILPGMYYATAEDVCGNPLSSESFHVSFQPLVGAPTLPSGPAGRCKGSGTSTYTSSAANSESISWSVTGTGNSISAAGVVTWHADFTGVAYVRATAQGCGGPLTSSPLSVNVGTVRVGELSGGGETCPNVTLELTFVLPNNDGTDVLYSLLRTHNGTTVGAGGTYMSDSNDQPLQIWTFDVWEPGTYTVVANGNNCTNVPMEGSAVITEREAADVIEVSPTGDLSQICLGSNVTINALNGSNVSWMFIPDGESEAIPAMLPPELSGHYYAVGQNECDVTIYSSNQVVRVYNVSSAVVTPPNPAKIKTTQSQVLTASIGENYTYAWLKNGVTIPNQSSNTITVTQSGTYTASISQSTFCPKTSNSVIVTVNQLPIVNSGDDVVVTLPGYSVSLNGSASDPDGTITGSTWSKISGDEVSIIAPNTLQPFISGLKYGSYVFRLSSTDDTDESAFDEITVNVVLPLNNYNWIKETIAQTEVTTHTGLDSLSISGEGKSVNWNYFDGIGRPLQNINVQASPSGADIVLPFIYDVIGRDSVKYLPYTSGPGDGLLKINWEVKQPEYYNGTQHTIPEDGSPFAKTIYEASPVNRVTESGAPGDAWQPVTTNKTVKKSYSSNGGTDVLFFNYDDSTGELTLAPGTYYAASTLYLETTVDEEQNDVLEYLDKQGRTVCKKVKAAVDTYACTYYIYDDLGSLVVVVPPEGVKKILALLNP